MTGADHEFYVVWDYGMGGLWGMAFAPNAEAITARYPQLTVFDQRPAWITSEDAEELVSIGRRFHLDDPKPDWFPNE